MKTIGIKELKTLVKKCLSAPGEFEGKTIVLWNADHLQYGIAYRVIEQCCVEYNQKNAHRQVWHKYSDFAFKTDDNTKIKVCCTRKDMYGFKDQGVLLNTGCFLKQDLNDWLTFINTHTNGKGKLSPDWVLIACAQADTYNLTENQFADNCVIYSIQPSFEEWSGWISQYNSPEVLNPIKAYIEVKNPDASFDYWQRILDALDGEDAKPLKQMAEEEFSRVVQGSIPGFPSKELWEFIQSL